MSLRKVNFVQGEYYHIYNRGNSKQVIFKDKGDYQHFVYLLYLSNSKRNFRINDISKDFFSFDREKQLVSVGAWVLMSNHFHIIITGKEDTGISKFMQKLTTAYSMYYNKKYKRTGGLFEGKFKSQHANTDRYIKYLFSYIHLNPVKLIQRDWKEKGIKDKKSVISFLNGYKYSSFKDYLFPDSRAESIILNKNDFPNYFPSKEKFRKEIFEWLSYTH
jgi:putative transposase